MTTERLPVCPIMQSQEYPTGWVSETVWHEETVAIMHLVPCNDLRLHQLDPTCWCKPVEDTETPDYWIHAAADQRELFEEGIRKPN